jgi:hypothetical protein
MTTGTSGMTRNKSYSSSSSSSSNERQQRQGLGTNYVEGVTGTGQSTQGGMGQGMPNQGYNQGTQSYPNTGITGTGHSETIGQMPVNQQGQLPTANTMGNNETKLTFMEKVKEKITHHGHK